MMLTRKEMQHILSAAAAHLDSLDDRCAESAVIYDDTGQTTEQLRSKAASMAALLRSMSYRKVGPMARIDLRVELDDAG